MPASRSANGRPNEARSSPEATSQSLTTEPCPPKARVLLSGRERDGPDLVAGPGPDLPRAALRQVLDLQRPVRRGPGPATCRRGRRPRSPDCGRLAEDPPVGSLLGMLGRSTRETRGQAPDQQARSRASPPRGHRGPPGPASSRVEPSSESSNQPREPPCVRLIGFLPLGQAWRGHETSSEGGVRTTTLARQSATFGRVNREARLASG